jgi:uncharacterized protein (DUF433 family)
MQTTTLQTKGPAQPDIQLVQELYGGEVYEHYPLGKYIIAAPDVCGGRPTFKYTRLELGMVLALLANGMTVDEVVQDYHRPELMPEAVQEALVVASHAVAKTFSVAQVVAAKA